MARWTEWKKIAKGDQWYTDELNYEGPSCYELGIKRFWLLPIQPVPVYAGETKNEKKRLSQYSHKNSHLYKIIKYHLTKGYTLYYRAQAKKTKEEAKQMQDNLLDKFTYPWNIQLNVEEED